MSYRDEVLADSPVGYWRLGESSGPTAVDDAGTNDGTYLNSPTLGATGALNDADTAMQSGSNGYVEVASEVRSGAGTGTIEVWVNTDSWVETGDSAHGVYQNVEAGTWDNRAGSVGIFKWTSDTFYFRVVNDAATLVDLTTDPWTNWLNLNGWNHLVLTFASGGDMIAYVNGQQVGTPQSLGTLSTFPTQPDTLIAQGHDQSASGTTYDEVAVYDTVLSAARVQAHYDARLIHPATASGASTTSGSAAAEIPFDPQASASGSSSSSGYTRAWVEGIATTWNVLQQERPTWADYTPDTWAQIEATAFRVTAAGASTSSGSAVAGTPVYRPLASGSSTSSGSALAIFPAILVFASGSSVSLGTSAGGRVYVGAASGASGSSGSALADRTGIAAIPPDSIAVATNLPTSPVSNVTDDPDAPDANWLVATAGGETPTSIRFTMAAAVSPEQQLFEGPDLQEFRILVRRAA